MAVMNRFAALSLALAAPAAAQGDTPPIVIEETGRSFWRLQDAVNAIGPGQGTILLAPGSYRQCAIQNAGAITYRAAVPGSAVLDGVACEGKAALVLKGASAVVDSLVFQNIRVADRNGAGIRLQDGDLTVINTTFRNSEQGILTHDDPESTLRIERSTFSGLGGCPDGMCSHSIYTGNYGRLIVTRSRFERGTGGHYVKSRAGQVEIADNSFDDTRGRDTNYMIDLPAGAVGMIARNEFVQGVSKENYSAFIAVGAETINHASAGLAIEGNHAAIAPGVRRGSTFVVDWTHEPLRLSGNVLGAGLTLFATR
jgi:hypothetical protein